MNIIELDNIWKWLGFCRLAGCKRVLVKNFQKDIDFKISFTQVGEKESSIQIGRSKENILMTIKCFKKLCLKSNTKKADEIHDYYIKLEKCNQKCPIVTY